MTEPKPSRDDEGYLRGWYLVETQGDYKRARQMAQQHSTYTKFKLTERQLKFLSGIVGGRRSTGFQPTMDVLVKHGLIAPQGAWVTDEPYTGYQATAEGVVALDQARAEGW